MKKSGEVPAPQLVIPPLEIGLTEDDVRRLHAAYGYNEVIPKKEKFIVTLLKKFIGPVEIILELLAIYFFLVAPFLPTSGNVAANSHSPPSLPTNGTDVTKSALSPVITNTSTSLAAAEGTSQCAQLHPGEV